MQTPFSQHALFELFLQGNHTSVFIGLGDIILRIKLGTISLRELYAASIPKFNSIELYEFIKEKVSGHLNKYGWIDDDVRILFKKPIPVEIDDKFERLGVYYDIIDIYGILLMIEDIIKKKVTEPLGNIIIDKFTINSYTSTLQRYLIG